jgi:hypothetical protein
MQTDINNKYIDLTNIVDLANVPLDIVGITRIFPLQDSQAALICLTLDINSVLMNFMTLLPHHTSIIL